MREHLASMPLPLASSTLLLFHTGLFTDNGKTDLAQNTTRYNERWDFFNVRTAIICFRPSCFSCHAYARTYQQQFVCAEYFWILYYFCTFWTARNICQLQRNINGWSYLASHVRTILALSVYSTGQTTETRIPCMWPFIRDFIRCSRHWDGKKDGTDGSRHGIDGTETERRTATVHVGPY